MFLEAPLVPWVEAGILQRWNIFVIVYSLLYQIRSYSPFFLSSRRDIPPERLYKVVRIAEKGGIEPGFGVTNISTDIVTVL